MLTVEREALSRRDPYRNAKFASDYPATVVRETGNAVPRGAKETSVKARTWLRLNQAEFARLIGRNDSTVEDWESPGKRKRDAPEYMRHLFGVLMFAQAPVGRELVTMIHDVGPLRALYALLKSAYEGPRLTSALAK